MTASLVGALSLGAAPVAAMAEDTGIDMQFADPEGAFGNSQIVAAAFQGPNAFTQNSYGVWETTYTKNRPVILNSVHVHMFGTSADADFKIIATDPNDDYEVAYYKRGADGKPADDQEITGDISEVGEYVAVVTAVEGNYEGGVIYVPFNINAIQVANVTVDGSSTVTYNGEAHEFNFLFNGQKVYEGVDYTVYYVPVGHDASEASATDVKNVGTYKAVVKGIGNYSGTVELSNAITVTQLNLTTSPIIGVATSSSDVEPKNLFAILIDGKWYSGGDAIMSDIKAELQNTSSTWFDNGSYGYKVTPANNDGNVIGENYFTANKVSYDLTFSYKGSALADSYEVYANDPSSYWNTNQVTGFAANGTVSGFSIDGSDIVDFGGEMVYKADGTRTTVADMNTNPGTYTIVYKYVSADGTIGGFATTTVTVYREAVNADAKAAVLYDTNGDGVEEVVSSVNKTFDGADLVPAIRVAVEDAAGRDVSGDCTVRYYNAEGLEVGEIVNAGTYTLKVTSSLYKLSGTTEMTITVGKLDLSNVRVNSLVDMPFDRTDNFSQYLPWTVDGYAISAAGANIGGLDLQYLPAGADASRESSWQSLEPYFTGLKVTILDASGEEVRKITDEGVYTIHFEARNEDAANNYVVPADLSVVCIMDGSQRGGVSHLLFADVQYTDYFADAVSAVNSGDFMNGYSDTWLFGSYDQLTRGQVACILYNMATYSRQVDESKLVYNELVGYETGFSDVNGKAYYGKAIAWAKQAGVVNGYGDGTFAPDAPVTREEFAAMVMNYASKYDQAYEAVSGTDALDKFDDANGVSEWAEEVVAWAVENGIMGNGGFLNAQGDIIRADAACMVYNYAFDL
ncbi:S-layer homology domain-containing protein [Collinsella tanakaei]|nr:S-layer homology domain-containing protein [Collinsella tanakaei]